MGILFVCNDINKPSHLWMRRMLDALGENVTVLAPTVDPETTYRRQRRTIVLENDRSSLFWRAIGKAGIRSGRFGASTAEQKLTAATALPEVTAVLINYLTLAVKFSSALQSTDKAIFVHSHGYDSTWDYRYYRPGMQRVHAENYAQQIKDLPGHVRFIVNSQTSHDRLVEIGIAEDRIFVKYMGVPVPDVFFTRPAKSEKINVLYLGRLVDCKGPDLVIQAFERACDLGLDGVLTLAGDGPLWTTCELLRTRSKYGDRIRILGEVDEATGISLREEADIFTAHNCKGPISRQEEAFGVSIAEAMASGLPILSGRSGSLSEIVDSGKNGVLFNPGDVEEHARQLVALSKDPRLRAELGRNGWAKARKLFTLEREAFALRSILQLNSDSSLPTQERDSEPERRVGLKTRT